MKIGLFAPSKSVHTDVQAQALKTQIDALSPGACQLFHYPSNASATIAVGQGGVIWDGVDVSQLTTAYVHGFSYVNPVIPPEVGAVDWSAWQIDYIGEQQQTSCIYSAFEEMARRGVKLLNPPRVQLQNFMKVDLLERCRDLGFRVPKTVCTNDLATVKTFCDSAENVTWRPATGRASWQLFLDKQRDALIAPDKPPVLLAELIPGPLVRAFVLNGASLMYLQNSPPNCEHLERLEVFRAIECPEASDTLRSLSEKISLPWALIWFVKRDDEIWIYDMDVDPIYHWLPDAYRQQITEGLACHLLDKKLPHTTSLDESQARATPFLRRMLRVLFEFEYKKYHQL